METAPFRLDDFTRMQWAPDARAIWEPRFRAVSNAWQDIEIQLVAMGFKPSALLVVASEKLAQISKIANHYSLSLAILGQQGRSGQPYDSTATTFDPNRPFDYRVAICKAPVTALWFNAWEANDTETMGVLLGYPECCRRFFQTFWVDQQRVDTTWEQAMNSGIPDSTQTINVHPDPACNVTLRYLGLRWVSHLPCSFTCEATRAYAADASKLIKANYPMEYLTLADALQWPVKWSALHGIAEIVTPVCRIISRTDATYTKYTVHQHGPVYPVEGARGNEFPFRNTKTQMRLVTRDLWTQNGFGSYEAMVNAHNTVVTAAGDVRGKSIIDLGCGTGELLKVYRGIASELHGVDTNAEALAKAKKVINVRNLNIFDPKVFDRKFDIAFISVQRFLETDFTFELIERLKVFTKETVFYSYGETEGWKVIQQLPRIIISPNAALKVTW